MRKYVLFLSFLLLDPVPVFADSKGRVFADQVQFEYFYEFTYQSNIVESFLLECTGKRDVSYKFAYATAPISNSYKHDILGLTELVPDPFANKPLTKRLWDEISLMVTRDYNKEDDYSDPVLMAQKEVLSVMDVFRDEKNILCDYIFWEEVRELEIVTKELIDDAKERKNGTMEIKEFNERAKEGLVVLYRLFNANPLRNKSYLK